MTLIDPASPLPVERAVICGPASGNRISDATTILMSPPLPRPPAVLAICPPPPTVRLSALTVTDPPAPDCTPVADAAICVPLTPWPSITRAPPAVTETEPPAPFPAVVLAIWPPPVIAICEADTVTDPASPLASLLARAMLPLPAPLRSEEHTSELQSQSNLVCRLLLE